MTPKSLNPPLGGLPNASIASASVPRALSYAEKLAVGLKSKQQSDSTTYYCEFDTDADNVIIKIPRQLLWTDFRKRDARTDDTGKQIKESATLVVSAKLKTDADATMRFRMSPIEFQKMLADLPPTERAAAMEAFDVTKGHNVVLEARQSLTMNIGLSDKNLRIEAIDDDNEASEHGATAEAGE